MVMNWDRVEGSWKQFTGKVKEKWGSLTDDDIATINGKREQLEGKLQERYGYRSRRLGQRPVTSDRKLASYKKSPARAGL